MRRGNEFRFYASLALGFVMIMAGLARGAIAQSRGLNGVAWSVDIPCEYAMALVQGVRSRGEVLSEEGCAAVSQGNKYIPDLVLRRAEDGQVASRIVVHDWPGFVKERQGQFFPGSDVTRWFNASLDPTFQFLSQSGTVLMKDSPWLAVVDLRSGSIVRSVLPSPDLTDPKSPALHVPLGRPIPMIVSVAHDRGNVAVASNIGKGPRMYIFNSDLTRQLRSWPLKRYIKDIAWSSDGKRVAVLYDGKFDRSGKFVGEFPQLMPVRLPDVAVFDAVTRAELIRFFTGGPEAEILFSPDGSLIYTISEASNVTSLQKDALRVFSSGTGRCVHMIAPDGPRMHDEFALSPDGRFIAADASSELGHPFWTEPVAFSNVTRVVVLDSKTGRVLFNHNRRIGVAVPLNPVFAPDGRLLIVQYGPYLSAKGKQRETIHVVAYSMPGS